MTKTEPTTPTQDNFIQEWHAEANAELAQPRTIEQVLKDAGLFVPHVKLEELTDTTFTIYEFREFPSTYPGQDKAFFAGCRDASGKGFTTVIGGRVLMETLEKIQLSGNTSPLIVTLRHKSGGAFEGYYIFE